ncbi:MAG: hypothetical protein WBM83_10335, partial [Flavobacteriaceae bacterium]
HVERYATKALSYNVNNINALETLLIVSRLKNKQNEFSSLAKSILSIDPLNHMVAFETARINAYTKEAIDSALSKIKNEFKEETLLDVAIRYHNLGFDTEALMTLMLGSKNPKNKLWIAYLQKDINESERIRILKQVLEAPIDLVFPYRRETLPVLEWANAQEDHWKLKYYLAQNYMAVGLPEKGEKLLKVLGEAPDSDIFYRYRAVAFKNPDYESKYNDIQKALKLNPSDWKVWEENILFLLENAKYDEAYTLSKKAYQKFKSTYNIELAHAKALLNTGRYKEVLSVLKSIQVLPYEHASESRKIYERAHLGLANALLAKKNYKAARKVLQASKEWPENIGVGKPYSPDERMQDYLLAICEGAMGNNESKDNLLQAIAKYTDEHSQRSDIDHLFGLLALKQLGDEVELTRQVAQLESDEGSENTTNRLVLALYKNDSETIAALQSQTKIPKDIWEGILAALQL